MQPDIVSIEQRNAVYEERNKCVFLLLRMAVMMGLRAGIGFDPEAESGWHHVVFIELPSGQVSWHIPYTWFVDALNTGVVPSYLATWDGHTTEEKYQRVMTAYAADVAAIAKGDALRPDPSQFMVNYPANVRPEVDLTLPQHTPIDPPGLPEGVIYRDLTPNPFWWQAEEEKYRKAIEASKSEPEEA